MRKSTILGGGCAVVLACAGHVMADSFYYTPIALTGVTNALGPNQGAVTFNNLGGSVPSINNFGQVVFRADTSAVASNGNAGIWVFDGLVNTVQAQMGGTNLAGGTYISNPSFGGFNNPIINGFGQIAFREGGGGSSTPNESALWSTAGTVNSVVVTKANAPGTNDGSGTNTLATFASISNPSPTLNSAGQTAFVANLTAGTGAPVVVNSGVNANFSGLWMGEPGSVSLVARQNQATSIPNVRLGSITATFGLNGGGKVLMLSNLQADTTAILPTGVASGTDQILLSNRNGGTTVNTWETIARRGSAVPDSTGALLADGTQYRSITASTAINDANKIAFTSTLRGGIAGTDTSFGALFSDTAPGATPGTMTMRARKGQDMPASTGLAGLRWGGTYSNIAINSGGTVVFAASGFTDADTGSGPSITSFVNDGGIFKMAADGTMSTVVRLGPASDSEPGAAPVGVPLKPGEYVRYSAFNDVSINALGQVAFRATLASSLGSGSGSLTPAQRSGLYLTNVDGGIDLIAQVGQYFQVAPGDIRQISGFQSVGGTGGENGAAMALNDNGDLVFSLTFSADTTNMNPNDDLASSGIFLVHVPAPGAGALLGLGGLLAARRRRR